MSCKCNHYLFTHESVGWASLGSGKTAVLMSARRWVGRSGRKIPRQTILRHFEHQDVPSLIQRESTRSDAGCKGGRRYCQNDVPLSQTLSRHRCRVPDNILLFGTMDPSSGVGCSLFAAKDMKKVHLPRVSRIGADGQALQWTDPAFPSSGQREY